MAGLPVQRDQLGAGYGERSESENTVQDGNRSLQSCEVRRIVSKLQCDLAQAVLVVNLERARFHHAVAVWTTKGPAREADPPHASCVEPTEVHVGETKPTGARWCESPRCRVRLQEVRQGPTGRRP